MHRLRTTDAAEALPSLSHAFHVQQPARSEEPCQLYQGGAVLCTVLPCPPFLRSMGGSNVVIDDHGGRQE